MKNSTVDKSELKNLTFIRPEKGKERFAPTPLHVVRSNAFSMEETGLLSLLVSFKDFICKETILAGAYFDNGEYSIQTAWQKLISKNIIQQKRLHVDGRWRWEYVINLDETDYQRNNIDVAATAAKYGVSLEVAAAMAAEWGVTAGSKPKKTAPSQPQGAQPEPVNYPEPLMRTQPEPAPQPVNHPEPLMRTQTDWVSDVAPHDAFAVELSAYLVANGFNQDIANDHICNFNTRLDSENMIYDDYKQYSNHFEMWVLAQPKQTAQTVAPVKSQPVAVAPVAPTLSATRHDNLKMFLLNDKDLKLYLLGENFQFGEAEVEAYILRLNNDKITHDSYGKFANHFKNWLPTYKTYQDKGKKLSKEGKVKKTEKEKKGSNINFNKLRKAVEHPKDGKTFEDWMFWVNQIVQETQDLTPVDVQYKNHLKFLKQENKLSQYFQEKKQKVDNDYNNQ